MKVLAEPNGNLATTSNLVTTLRVVTHAFTHALDAPRRGIAASP